MSDRSVAVLALSVLLSTSACTTGKQASKPNFVFILSDDMGWRDTGVYGSPVYRTPNIDRLASQGMRFTDAYSAANVCSPTRASILTGKHPARLHLTTWIPGHRFPWAKLREPEQVEHLPLEEITLAEALGEAGYRTASFGKWHLGGAGFGPEEQGFDESFQKTAREPHYLTDRRVTDLAVRFLEANRDRPFFLYVPYYSVHEPIAGPAEYEAAYRERWADSPEVTAVPAGNREPLAAGHYRTDYAAMVQAQDDQVGRILEAVERLGLADDTVLIFVSDNGGLARATPNAPLKGGKGTMYEGGVRVPWIVRWPGRIRAGSTCDVPVTSTDFFPTMLELAGAEPLRVDGTSIVPLLRESGGLRREALHWHFPHYHGLGAVPYSSIRRGDWKLIEFLEDNRLELYDLSEDPGEDRNVVASVPETADALRRELHAWRESVGAQMPSANPDYDPLKADLWPAGPGTRRRTALP